MIFQSDSKPKIAIENSLYYYIFLLYTRFLYSEFKNNNLYKGSPKNNKNTIFRKKYKA